MSNFACRLINDIIINKQFNLIIIHWKNLNLRMLNRDNLKKIRKIFNHEKEYFFSNAFKALGDANRCRIFRLLMEKSRLSAGDIAEILKISRPLASQHLKIMEHSQLFQKEKIGQRKFYRIDLKNHFANSIAKIIQKFEASNRLD